MGNLGRERKLNEIELTPKILRELQLIQLECLTELDRICRANDIDYSLDGGTLLGAVRHGGFIPWDDDIDVIMLRDDYEMFYGVCKTELDSKRFFLQERRTDPHYCVGYPRIRRNGTVYRRAGHEHMKYHEGVFIDIFVLDNVPDNKFLRILHRFVCFCNRKILWSKSGKRIAPNVFWRSWFSLVSLIPAAFAFWCNDVIARVCNRRKTELVRHNTHPYPNPKVCGYGIPCDLLERYTELEFEEQRFRAVAENERYLTMLYGNFMILPPVEERKPSVRLAEFGWGRESYDS
ncbi:MAG: LicD family protein [Fibromonadaceae bacterium]|jgi:lipopolysaccharide cholinephosphotransferase|nr:LicD family protein [Fibromonadaceae bacterium]